MLGLTNLVAICHFVVRISCLFRNLATYRSVDVKRIKQFRVLVIIPIVVDSPLALGLTAVANQLVALVATTDPGRNADPIALTTIVLALGQAAGGVRVIAITLATVTLVPRLTVAILAVAAMGMGMS